MPRNYRLLGMPQTDPLRHNQLFVFKHRKCMIERIGWFNYTSGVKTWQYILCYSWSKYNPFKQAMEIVNKITIMTSWWWFSECHQSVHNGTSARLPSSVAVHLHCTWIRATLPALVVEIYMDPGTWESDALCARTEQGHPKASAGCTKSIFQPRCCAPVDDLRAVAL